MTTQQGVLEERKRWIAWLASTEYGVEWKADIDPPCRGIELAEVYVRGGCSHGTANRCLVAMQQEAGVFMPTGPGGGGSGRAPDA